MRHIWTGVTAILGILAVLMSAAPSYALIMLTNNTTEIGKIVIVSPQPGNSAIANGTALLNALNGITDASDTNPYVLKLGPGIYDLGTCDTSGTPPFSCVLYMKEFVDIEGSGEKTTKITGAIDGTASLPPIAGTVMGANNAELRFLTVENTSAGSYVIAILNSSKSPSILHVTATASGTASYNIGVWNASASPILTNVTAIGSNGTMENRGVHNANSSSPIMTNVTAIGSGAAASNYGVRNVGSSSPAMTNVTATGALGTNNYGVYNNSSSPTMTNVTATGSGGTANIGVYNNNSSGTVKIDHSVLRGATNSISNGAGVATLIGSSKLEGAAYDDGTSGGSITCVGVYDANYSAFSCP